MPIIKKPKKQCVQAKVHICVASDNSKYNRSTFPDSLKALSDDALDEYFKNHPNSKYNPFRFDDGTEGEEYDDGGGSNNNGNNGNNGNGRPRPPPPFPPPENDAPKHKLPLYKRLTFKGWVQSAPLEMMRDKKEQIEDAIEDLNLKRVDLTDKISDLKDKRDDYKEARADTERPRKRKRLSKKISNLSEKIAGLREKVIKTKSRVASLKQRRKMLDKALMKRKNEDQQGNGSS